HHTALINELLNIQTQQPTPIWLKTDIAFIPLFNTLRKLLYSEKADGSQILLRYYDSQCLPNFLAIAYKNPYYANTMQQIQWAVWQQQDEKYQHYDKSKPGVRA